MKPAPPVTKIMLIVRSFGTGLPQESAACNGALIRCLRERRICVFAPTARFARRREWHCLDTLNTGCYPKCMSATEYAQQHLAASREALVRAEADGEFLFSIGKIAEAITASLMEGGKVLLCGNGGSAADAQHIAAEFVGRYEGDRPPLAAIALTTDTSALTAIGNDYGFDHVFERQVQALGKMGDVLIAISTSGKSPNVLRALETAKKLGLFTVGFGGAHDGPMAMHCNLMLRAPSDKTPVIQQIHITAAHIICGIVERELAK
jgi:D-sedoheptulose 7-phosphate isomerase